MSTVQKRSKSSHFPLFLPPKSAVIIHGWSNARVPYLFPSHAQPSLCPFLQEEYILKWRDYQSNFFELAEDLFVNELLTDVTVCCRDQTFEAHRLVLSVCSTYFRAVFTSPQLRQRGSGQGHPVIFIKVGLPFEFDLIR